VPRSMREGSYACGRASGRRCSVSCSPRDAGIMTGSSSRWREAREKSRRSCSWGGETRPRPSDRRRCALPPSRPELHAPRFHIYDVGFQSQNSEASKPMVFTTTLLLIVLIAALNVAAIWVRTRLRRKFLGAQF